jgi:hypothetical protein
MDRDEIGGRGDREPLLPRRLRIALLAGVLAVAAAVGLPRLTEAGQPDRATPSPRPAATSPAATEGATDGATEDATDGATEGGTVGGTEPVDPARAAARVGFIGLPPSGAAPSTPRGGRLVVAVWTPAARAWVYADGRLITLRYEDRPVGANPASTGLLEQRLTASGVERLRSWVARSAHSLGPVPARPSTAPSNPLVRVGDRLRMVDRPSLVCDAGRCPRVTSPELWLPPDAWRRESPKAYVPSRFAVCYGLRASGDTADISDAPAVPDASLFGRTAGGDRRLPADWPCSVVTTQRAARIVQALRRARVLRDSTVGSRILAYVVDVRSPRAGTPPHEARLFFEPLLPDDRWPCSACG